MRRRLATVLDSADNKVFVGDLDAPHCQRAIEALAYLGEGVGKRQPEHTGPRRNRPCPCGSGRKLKKCVGTKVASHPEGQPPELAHLWEFAPQQA